MSRLWNSLSEILYRLWAVSVPLTFTGHFHKGQLHMWTRCWRKSQHVWPCYLRVTALSLPVTGTVVFFLTLMDDFEAEKRKKKSEVMLSKGNCTNMSSITYPICSPTSWTIRLQHTTCRWKDIRQRRGGQRQLIMKYGYLYWKNKIKSCPNQQTNSHSLMLITGQKIHFNQTKDGDQRCRGNFLCHGWHPAASKHFEINFKSSQHLRTHNTGLKAPVGSKNVLHQFPFFNGFYASPCLLQGRAGTVPQRVQVSQLAS